MKLKTLQNLDVAGKRVFVRVDFNVPLQNGEVGDDSRIRAALPTIQFLQEKGAKIILASHAGRPKGEVIEELRLAPVAAKLSEILGQKVQSVRDCVGSEVAAAVEKLQPGEILLLENLRFHAGETANDPEFAAALAANADVVVEDAFGCVHRAHASTVGVTEILPAAAGLLVEREVTQLSQIFNEPQRPLVVVLGGAKIDTKLGVLRRFVELADAVVVGGGIANTFLAARENPVGASLFEFDKLELAREIFAIAEKNSCEIILPTDVVVSNESEFSDEMMTIEKPISEVCEHEKILDVGADSRAVLAEKIASAGTLVWNGPVGVFEFAPLAKGTRTLAEAAATTAATTILGGGDTLAAIAKFGFAPEKFTHVSTGGGAMLEFLEGKELPGLAVLRATN